ncbi:hypothetical protein ACWC09_47825 [Streptomyces sp. NPDC001617]
MPVLEIGGQRTLRAEEALTMEQLSQDFGFVRDLTTLAAAGPALLTVGDVRDSAQLFLDGQLVGGLEREKHEPALHDRKGPLGPVAPNGVALTGRQRTPPGLDEAPATSSSRPTASSP